MPVDLAAIDYDNPDARGVPVVILHGLFGSGRNWASIAQRLASAHRVVALDARNHGASPWADTMSYAEMAEDVLAALRARGITSAALLGHSMGGKAAMICALLHPESVERLVVVDVAPAAHDSPFGAYIAAMRSVDLAGVSRRGEVDRQLAAAVPDPAERAFLLQNLVFEDGAARWRINLDALARTLTDIASFPSLPVGASYAGPALFIAGERSDYLRPKDEPAIHRLFPKAEIRRIAGAGHWVHAEAPDAFLDLVTPFLAGR
jgi:pimeloyl-ACP methyl ester carboxylesterase